MSEFSVIKTRHHYSYILLLKFLQVMRTRYISFRFQTIQTVHNSNTKASYRDEVRHTFLQTEVYTCTFQSIIIIKKNLKHNRCCIAELNCIPCNENPFNITVHCRSFQVVASQNSKQSFDTVQWKSFLFPISPISR